jgi:hypothetical protein
MLFMNLRTVFGATVESWRNMRTTDHAKQPAKPAATPTAPARTSWVPLARYPSVSLW